MVLDEARGKIAELLEEVLEDEGEA